MDPNYRYQVSEFSSSSDPNNYRHGTSITSSSSSSSQTEHVERRMQYSTIQEVQSSSSSSFSSSTSYSSSSTSSSSFSSHSLSSGGRLMLQNSSDPQSFFNEPDSIQAFQLVRDKILTSGNSGRDVQQTSHDEIDQEFEKHFGYRSPINNLLNRSSPFSSKSADDVMSQFSSNRFK